MVSFYRFESTLFLVSVRTSVKEIRVLNAKLSNLPFDTSAKWSEQGRATVFVVLQVRLAQLGDPGNRVAGRHPPLRCVEHRSAELCRCSPFAEQSRSAITSDRLSQNWGLRPTFSAYCRALDGHSIGGVVSWRRCGAKATPSPTAEETNDFYADRYGRRFTRNTGAEQHGDLRITSVLSNPQPMTIGTAIRRETKSCQGVYAPAA